MSLMFVRPVVLEKPSTAPLTGAAPLSQFPPTLQSNGVPAFPVQMLLGPWMVK